MEMMTSKEKADWNDGMAAAAAEIARDGWTLHTAQRYIDATRGSVSGSAYGRGFDAGVVAFVVGRS